MFNAHFIIQRFIIINTNLSKILNTVLLAAFSIEFKFICWNYSFRIESESAFWFNRLHDQVNQIMDTWKQNDYPEMTYKQ